MHNRFRPRRAAARKPSIDVDATHTGGYGFCSGRGSTETSGTEK